MFNYMILVNNYYMKKSTKHIVYKIFYQNSRILKFNNNEIISEEDIFNLFSGFVRLIKKSVEIKMEDKYLNRINYLENKLSKFQDK